MEEFVIEWIKGDKKAAISAPSGTKIKNKLIKLTKEHPDECDYILNKDGYIFGHVPVNYIKISRPREYSEEERKKMGARFHT